MNFEDLLRGAKVEGACMSFLWGFSSVGYKLFLPWPGANQRLVPVLLGVMMLREDPVVQGVVPRLVLPCLDFSNSSSVVWSLWCSWKVSLPTVWPTYFLYGSVTCEGMFLLSTVLSTSSLVQFNLPTQENQKLAENLCSEQAGDLVGKITAWSLL